MPVAGAMVRSLSIATGATIAEGTTDAAGEVTLTGADLSGSVTIEVDGPTSSQIVMGVRTDEVVIGLPAREARTTIRGNVRGLPAGASASVGIASDVSLLRTPTLAHAATGPCSASGEGACAFAIDASLEGDTLAAATVSDAAGTVLGFVIGDVGAAGGTLDAALGAPVDLAATLPAATGLTGIVGVPGVARDGALVLLPQSGAAPGLFAVPSLDADLADARYWLIVEARPTTSGGTGDPAARSVLFARGVRSAAELPTWSAWLPAPEASVDAEARVSFEAVPGADAHVVDWLDAAENVLGSAWLIDDTVLFVDELVPPGITPSEVATVRVRAIGSSAPPRLGAFEATELDAGVTRFSERDVAR